ncbi:RNF family protein [Schizosaccharomyces cryophilus OY26]|uniref:RNF family protein n=1 Tax=Schizosaccharomyces cryophilus (strain OY26 / ATCC MYA-4695 / CBS 11777 / NBRC 106824 / NRRL Y48691) TaxID=653667 RepID=S9X1L0_SCHCR|nr:RNF family protein [Schizosaccharomyces cryophilus OY26]EPY50992.1 RNF family protein [Schizosaccharomyces cryophilus OY26]
MSNYSIILCTLASISYVILLEVIALDFGILDNIFSPKRFAASTDVALQLPARNVTLWARQASFGKRLTNSSYTTKIQLSLPSNFQEDMTGCSDVQMKHEQLNWSDFVKKQEQDDTDDDTLCFLMVQRGKCTFFEKALHAQRLGYKGIVVGDNRKQSSSHLQYMVGPGKEDSKVSIPSLFISTASFNILYSDILYSENRSLVVYAKPEELSDMFWPFLLCFSPSIIMLATVQALAIRRVIRTYKSRSKTKEFIQNLPSRTISREGFYEDEEDIENDIPDRESVPLMDESSRRAAYGVECVICLEAFNRGDKVIALPCKHEFHRNCISKWVVDYRHTCPTCNAIVPFAGSPSE